jgi:predicted RNase H-like HicB family nuclease
MKKLELTAVYVECEEGGYAAYVEEMDGVNGQGETLEEARESLLEALDLVVQTRR